MKKSAALKIPKHHWFYDDLFLFNFRLVWPVTAESLERYVAVELKRSDWKIPWKRRGFGAKYLYIPMEERGGGTHVVALTEWKGNSDNHSALSHECAHAAREICAQRSIRVTSHDDETFCYLQAFLLRRCLNVLMPKKQQVTEARPRLL